MKITLRDLIESHMGRDEIMWAHIINPPIQMDVPIEIKEFTPEEVRGLQSIQLGGIEFIDPETGRVGEPFDAEQMQRYIDCPPQGLKGIIIIKGDEGVVDGHHRTLAAINRGDGIRYVDIKDSEYVLFQDNPFVSKHQKPGC